jgi:hypothetical protein
MIISEQQGGGGGVIMNNNGETEEAGGGGGGEQQQQDYNPTSSFAQVLIPPLGGFHYSNHHYSPTASSLLTETMHPPCLDNEGPNNNNININSNNNFVQPKKSAINFDQRIEELRIYKATYGHLNIKRDTHKCLYDFCSNVRSSVTLAQQQKASGNNNGSLATIPGFFVPL